MNPPAKKSPPFARGTAQIQPRAASSLSSRPAVVSASATRKLPASPPVYRPQSVCKACQTRPRPNSPRAPQASRQLVAASAADHPQLTSNALQRKSSSSPGSPAGTLSTRPPAAPPVYRPQAKRIVQAIETTPPRKAVATPPDYRQRPVTKVLQAQQSRKTALLNHPRVMGKPQLRQSGVPAIRSAVPPKPNSQMNTLRPGIQRKVNQNLARPTPHRISFSHAIQLKVGYIFRGVNVIEHPTGEVYFLPNALRNTIADDTPVSFDLADANYVTNVATIAVTTTEARAEQDARVTVQVSAQSCGIEVVRMVYNIVTGDNLTRNDVKDAVAEIDVAGYDPALGLSVDKLPTVLKFLFDYYTEQHWRFRQPTIAWEKLELDKLAAKLGANRPAIAVLKNPNHVVVIDSVTGNYPNRQISYRDPDHAAYVVASENKFFERAIGSYFTFT